MKILIDTERCSGCKTCVKVCPQLILDVVDEKVMVKDESICMGCFGCEDECPENAIRLLRAPDGVEPEIEPGPQEDAKCDVVIVGAGPAGLGAAIECARSGLETIVCERLPNRKLSHHVDGGMMVAMNGSANILADQDSFSFPDLDISLPGSIQAGQIEQYGLVGPQGISTDNRFLPGTPPGHVVNKNRFVEELANLAERFGAHIRFNAKVTDFIKDGDNFIGVTLADGSKVEAKVVICADGILAKMSAKAGIPANKKGLEKMGGKIIHVSLMAYEFDNVESIQRGLLFMNGGFDEDMPPALGAVTTSDHVEVLIGIMGRKKFHPSDKPMEHYLKQFMQNDPRVKEILGDHLEGKPVKIRNGCRCLFRATNRDIVDNGLMSIGDAFVAGGELGNVAALAMGVFAGKVVRKAADKGDFSKEALLPVVDFITPDLEKASTQNGSFKCLPMRMNEAEMLEFFKIMQHANYPTMIFGPSARMGWMFTKLMVRNLGRFIRNPGMLKYMM